jgi:uncharacterized damage-inducible protein DinB
MEISKKAFLIILAFIINDGVMAQGYFKEQYRNVWQRASDYMLEVAEAMPANKYNFKPLEGSMTFHEQLTHVVGNLSFLTSRITGERPDFFKSKKPEELSKEEMIVVVGEALKYVRLLVEEADDQMLRENIEFRGEKMTKENIFYLMRDHASHHRGQAILYLRMNGIEAPMYRGW